MSSGIERLKTKFLMAYFFATSLSTIAQTHFYDLSYTATQSKLNEQTAAYQSSIAERNANYQSAEAAYEISLAEQAEQNQEAKKQIQDQIDSLTSDVNQKGNELYAAKFNVDALRQRLLETKRFIPKDPWREVHGETKYLSADSDYIKFTGQIQEIAENRIRVLGQYGNSQEQVEYFVINLPYHFDAGDIIVQGDNYAAFENGEFTYVTEDAEAKSLPQLNYGHPCARPANADTVEYAAQQLSDADNEQITNAIINAASREADLVAAQKALKDFLDATIFAASIKKKAAQDWELKYDQEQAAKGDPVGLERMGERYTKGDDVETNSTKAAEYFKKADEMNQAIIKQKSEESKLKEQAAKQDKFNKNLNLADRGDIDCMIYVGKCYMDGDSVEKDLSKAREYFQKASDLGSIEATQLLSSCEKLSQ